MAPRTRAQTPVPPVADDGLGDFTVAVSSRTINGVSGEIPSKLAQHLATEVPKILGNPSMVLTLTARDEEAAKLLVSYAKAWGTQQTPKLYVRKLPNSRDIADNVARLAVVLDSDVKPENKPGRRTGR